MKTTQRLASTTPGQSKRAGRSHPTKSQRPVKDAPKSMGSTGYPRRCVSHFETAHWLFPALLGFSGSGESVRLCGIHTRSLRGVL